MFPDEMDADSLRQLVAAEGYLELGMPAQAVAELDELPTGEQQNSEVMGLRVMAAQAVENWPQAAALAATLVGREPENPRWWVSYAYALRRSENIGEAEKILLCAYDMHPDEPLIPYNLACYAAQTGRVLEARYLLDAALKLEPKMKELALHDPDLKPLEGRLRPEKKA